MRATSRRGTAIVAALAAAALLVTGTIAVTAHGPREAESLREAGADQVLMPFKNAADHAAEQVLGWLGAKEGR